VAFTDDLDQQSHDTGSVATCVMASPTQPAAGCALKVVALESDVQRMITYLATPAALGAFGHAQRDAVAQAFGQYLTALKACEAYLSGGGDRSTLVTTLTTASDSLETAFRSNAMADAFLRASPPVRTISWVPLAINSVIPPPATPAPTADIPSPTPAPTPEQVVFACQGKAPSGLEITYGPDGSNYSATRLPFQRTLPLSADAQYYVTTAQLHGSGSVTCTTTVQWNGYLSARKSGTAEGGYNIASAQICKDFQNDWTPC
jgi:hypothetical protein